MLASPAALGKDDPVRGGGGSESGDETEHEKKSLTRLQVERRHFTRFQFAWAGGTLAVLGGNAVWWRDKYFEPTEENFSRMRWSDGLFVGANLFVGWMGLETSLAARHPRTGRQRIPSGTFVLGWATYGGCLAVTGYAVGMDPWLVEDAKLLVHTGGIACTLIPSVILGTAARRAGAYDTLIDHIERKRAKKGRVNWKISLGRAPPPPGQAQALVVPTLHGEW